MAAVYGRNAISWISLIDRLHFKTIGIEAIRSLLGLLNSN